MDRTRSNPAISRQKTHGEEHEMRKAVYKSQRVAGVSRMALSCSAWQRRSLLGLSHGHPRGSVAVSCLQPPPTTLLTVPT